LLSADEPARDFPSSSFFFGFVVVPRFVQKAMRAYGLKITQLEYISPFGPFAHAHPGKSCSPIVSSAHRGDWAFNNRTLLSLDRERVGWPYTGPPQQRKKKIQNENTCQKRCAQLTKQVNQRSGGYFIEFNGSAY
jgi:hypothetical protein